ncbi:hypothetical protein [Burkholderia phage FLC6]|nr:hypothetical protein [Burkholderia phage FLC6]
MPGQILTIEEKEYPLEEAIQKAAEQNVRRDYTLHVISEESFDQLSDEGKKKYIDEATRVLLEFGVNYVPIHPETERIRVQKPADDKKGGQENG